MLKIINKIKCWVFKNKDTIEVKYTPNKPLTWWVDDVTHRVCGLIDHPEVGLDKMPWPDCDKVYLAVDKKAYDKLRRDYLKAICCLREGCLVYDQHVPSGSSSFRLEAQCIIDAFEKHNL